jgi:hypothetical protein
MAIKAGASATYVGEPFEFLRPGGSVFVRSVGETTAHVQDPWDSHNRITVDLVDLKESSA